MITDEFSNEFDVLYNQVNSNQAPGLDEYEKSVFLTNAQDEIIIAFFNPRGNKFIQGMDDSPEKQYDFSTLIRNDNKPITQALSSTVAYFDDRSYIAEIDKDVLLIINESLQKYNGVNPVLNDVVQVVPISYVEYTNQMQKPYKYPPKNMAWRLVTDGDITTNSSQQPIHTFNTNVELISAQIDDSYKYKYRYVKRPSPIILTNLPTGLSIHGETSTKQCELPVTVHGIILKRAVELATAVYNPSALGNIVGVGNASGTNLGQVQQNNQRQ